MEIRLHTDSKSYFSQLFKFAQNILSVWAQCKEVIYASFRFNFGKSRHEKVMNSPFKQWAFSTNLHSSRFLSVVIASLLDVWMFFLSLVHCLKGLLHDLAVPNSDVSKYVFIAWIHSLCKRVRDITEKKYTDPQEFIMVVVHCISIIVTMWNELARCI